MPTIRKRKDDGRYQAKITVAGQRQTITGRTRQEVEDKAVKRLAAKREGRAQPLNKLSLGEYLDWWLANCFTPSPNGMLNREDCTRLYLKPFLGHLKLSKLEAADLHIYTRILSPSEIELVRLMNERLPKLIEEGSQPQSQPPARKRVGSGR